MPRGQQKAKLDTLAWRTLADSSAGVLFCLFLRQRLSGLLFPDSEKHIAVLPFDIVGGDAENDAVVQGLMDSLTGTLSNLEVGKKSL